MFLVLEESALVGCAVLERGKTRATLLTIFPIAFVEAPVFLNISAVPVKDPTFLLALIDAAIYEAFPTEAIFYTCGVYLTKIIINVSVVVLFAHDLKAVFE